MEGTKQKPPLVVIGAKVPVEIRNAIQRRAIEEERTISQTISRLLASHPLIEKSIKHKPAKVAV